MNLFYLSGVAARDFNRQNKIASDASDHLEWLRRKTSHCHNANADRIDRLHCLSKNQLITQSLCKPTQLNSNLYTTQNLANACVVGTPSFGSSPSGSPIVSCNGVTINTSAAVPFYFSAVIDPKGQLFGNSQCGELNFIHFNQCNLVASSTSS